MGKDDEPKDDAISQAGKTLLPFWKTSGNVIKSLILFTLLAALAMWWKPWKKDEPTSRQIVTSSPGSIVTVGQSGGSNTVINQGPITRTITPAQEAEIINLFRPFWQTHLQTTNAVVYIKVANSGDKEQMDYADRLSEVIRHCGVSTGDFFKRNISFAPDAGFGIELSYDSQHPPAYAIELERVFQAVGIMPPRLLPLVGDKSEGSGNVVLCVLNQSKK
jgi:hypothetical protein